MHKKLLGVVFCSMGTGMLIVIFLPSWGFIAAVALVTAGILLCNCK